MIGGQTNSGVASGKTNSQTEVALIGSRLHPQSQCSEHHLVPGDYHFGIEVETSEFECVSAEKS
jgi:hypothetical protein